MGAGVVEQTNAEFGIIIRNPRSKTLKEGG